MILKQAKHQDMEGQEGRWFTLSSPGIGSIALKQELHRLFDTTRCR
jgi:hypothetical protein